MSDFVTHLWSRTADSMISLNFCTLKLKSSKVMWDMFLPPEGTISLTSSVCVCVCARAHTHMCLRALIHVQLFGTPARLLCPWNSPGKNTGVGCHFLLQGIFLTQGSYLHLLTPPALAGRFFSTVLPGKSLKKQRRN